MKNENEKNKLEEQERRGRGRGRGRERGRGGGEGGGEGGGGGGRLRNILRNSDSKSLTSSVFLQHFLLVRYFFFLWHLLSHENALLPTQ